MGSAIPNRATMARVAAYLWCAGALTVLAILALPHSDTLELPFAWATLALCACCSLAMWRFGESFPAWVFHAGTLLASATISAAIQWHSDLGADVEMLYLWVVLYAFYFFGWRAAAAHLAVIGASYAAVLLSRPGGDARVTEWLLTAGGLSVAGAIVGLLRDRLLTLVSRLETAALTDSLTGLLNRRGFEGILSTEIERARRHERPLALVVADIDHFKQVNDRFGHAAGDAALERVAAILAEGVRRLDTVARIGGEEFAMIVPDSDEHAAMLLAERLRRDVRETFAGNMAELTMSFGVATFPKDAGRPTTLLQAADRALYLAKELGRDRSVVYADDTAALLADLLAGRDTAAG